MLSIHSVIHDTLYILSYRLGRRFASWLPLPGQDTCLCISYIYMYVNNRYHSLTYTHVQTYCIVNYAPLADSPLNMTQSAPSNTALYTSVHSARVGRGFFCIDSNLDTRINGEGQDYNNVHIEYILVPIVHYLEVSRHLTDRTGIYTDAEYVYAYMYSLCLHLSGHYYRFARLHAQLDDLLLHVGQALHGDLNTYSRIYIV